MSKKLQQGGNSQSDAERLAFDEVVAIIHEARAQSTQMVNTILIDLYWRIGAYISRKIETAEWGEGVVKRLAEYLQERHSNVQGFSRPNLFRMRMFYKAYASNERVAPLVRQLPWTHHLVILSHAKSADEREFYIRQTIHEKWSKRELERQIGSGRYAKSVLNPIKVSPVVRQSHPNVTDIFRDRYVLEFLGLPIGHSESELHVALVQNIRRFLRELGRDFCYISSEFPLQVGGQDFALDLLFFHRGLNCLVAIELKAVRFEPDHLGKLNFYLEALDRDHKKAHENPAIGLLLCATKDNEVVEYALNRSLSPTVIAEYETKLPDKNVLRAKLHELVQALEHGNAHNENQYPDFVIPVKVRQPQRKRGAGIQGGDHAHS